MGLQIRHVSAATRTGHLAKRPSSGRPRSCQALFQSQRPTKPVNGDASQALLDLAAGQVRHGSDSWHAILRFRAADHRVWLKEPPAVGIRYVAQLPLDGDFGACAFAARRPWRAMNGRTPGPAFHELSKQQRERFSTAIRALDALFGKGRIPHHAWKTHDLRSRTIRLAQSGLALIRGGSRELPRPLRKDK